VGGVASGRSCVDDDGDGVRSTRGHLVASWPALNRKSMFIRSKKRFKTSCRITVVCTTQ
jgi:hypothetical protein